MSTDHARALLACPFCGGEANGTGHMRYGRPLDDTWWEDGSQITEAFFVNCIRCGISNGPPALVGGYQTQAEAIAAWNTRALSTAQTERSRIVEWLKNDAGDDGTGLWGIADAIERGEHLPSPPEVG